jgi:hypothetical protein
MRVVFLLLLLLCQGAIAKAQFKHRIKKNIRTLCTPSMFGRGYVNDGVNKAANFLHQKMEKAKLIPFTQNANPYFQPYTFAVNTHPNEINLNVVYYNGQQPLKPGYDFLIDAASPSINAKGLHILGIDASDSNQRKTLLNHPGFPANTALVLRFMPRGQQALLKALRNNPKPPALLVFTVKNKLTHTISTNLDSLPAIWIFDSLLNNANALNIQFKNTFHKTFTCNNVAGYIPGKNTDSFIVFSAHFDHLGMMGPDARFAGASDNASGTAFLLELMRYYKKHQPAYNTAFLFFSGEEAGLIGSKHFVENPLLPLKRIKHLINIDIMGNAEQGITVVNADAWPERFKVLQQTDTLFPVKPRGASNNSDHAPFSNKGVPAFFIYSNGGPGFYHDVFDRPETCQLKGVKTTHRLIRSFIKQL